MPQEALTTIEIARAYAKAFVEDRTLRKLAEDAYGKTFSVSIGANLFHPPDDKDAPWIVIFPNGMGTGPQRKENTHALDIVAGIDDKTFTEGGPYRELRGLSWLSCKLLPRLARCMDDALPRARLQEMDVEYEISLIPLLEMLVSVTVTESRPVGLRR